MNSPSRVKYVVRGLSALAIGVSLFWLWPIFVMPWLKFLGGPKTGALEILFMIFMPTLLGLPAFLGLYFGWRGIRRTDAVAVKGLVASYCIGIAFFLAVFVDRGITQGLNKSLWRDVVVFLVAVGSVGVYLVVSRRLLRSLGQYCPPIRQSLPIWPVILLAFLLWGALIQWVKVIFPVRSEDTVIDFALSGGAMISATLLAVAAFKLGVWLFVKQSAATALGESRDSCRF